MIKTFKLLFREPEKRIALVALRERLLKIILLGSVLIGTFLYATALVPAFQRGLTPTILVYSALYIWIILITFVPGWSYRTRAVSWLAIFYALGCINLFEGGLNVDAGLFFITSIAMAILLMDLRCGVIEIALVSITISLVGYLNVTGYMPPAMGLSQTNPWPWVIGGITFFLMGGLLVYFQGIVVNELEENLAKTALLTGELEQTNQSLQRSEAQYRALVETSPGLVVLLDLEGNILTANRVGLALFGYEHLEEAAGKNMLAFIAPDDRARVAELFQKSLAAGETTEVDFLALRKDGSTFFGEFSAALVKDEAGRPQAITGIGRDVTARMAADQSLQKTKDMLAELVIKTTVQLNQTTSRLEELAKYGPTVIYSYRASDHAITYISENVARLVGYEAHHFLEDANFWPALVHPEDKERILALLERQENQERAVYEYRLLKEDGTYAWMRSERILIRDEEGNPSEYIGSWSDVTEQKNAEETLKLSETRYRDLYESMMDAYVSVEMDGRIRQFNQVYQQMVGYEPDELRKMTYQDLTPPQWHAFEAKITEEQVMGRGYSDIYEKEYIRKDGSVFPVELRAALIRDAGANPSGMWALIRDISQRKISELTLFESEQRYRELLDASMQGVVIFQDARIIYVNQVISESFGYTGDELKALTPDEIGLHLHPDDRRIFQERMLKRLEGISVPELYSLRVIHKNGETRWLEARTVSIEINGQPALMTTTMDVSAIKRVEAELQESERMLRSILNASDALVFLADTQGVVIASNEKFMERLGLRTDTVPGAHIINEIFHEIMTQSRKEHFDQVVRSGGPITFVDSHEGTWFENSFYPVLDASGKVVRVAAYIRDITEQRQMMEDLRISEEKYRNLAEAAHDIIFIISQYDRIEYINSFGAKFLGQAPERLVGQPRARFFPLDTDQHQEESLMQVFKTGQPLAIENANLFPGGPVWLNTWLVPLKETDGEVISVLGVSRDITAHKKAEEAMRRSEQAARLAADHLRMVNQIGLHITAGLDFEQLLQTVYEQCRQIGDTDTFYLAIYEAATDMVSVPFCCNDGVHLTLPARRLEDAPGVTAYILEHRQTFYTPDISYLPTGLTRIVGTGLPKPSYLGVPLVLNERAIGVLSMQSRLPDAYSPDQIHTLELLSTQVAVAIQNSQLYQQVQQELAERKRAEEELRQARDLLEERVAERTKELSESQDELRSLTIRTVKAQEEERRTVSRELHDEAGQALITLQYSLTAIQDELPETEALTRERLSDAVQIINKTMLTIRTLAHSLRPPVLEIGGINMSLREYCREQTERTRVQIDYWGEDIPGLPDEISISLYRFVQEALTNTLKHAHATQARVSLQYKKREIAISVSDNGRGMDDIVQSDGMGLLGIRERLTLLGGRLDVKPQKGHGAQLIAYVPWENSKVKSG